MRETATEHKRQMFDLETVTVLFDDKDLKYFVDD